MADLSLCIPTRNRAAYLSRGLDHLLTFTQIDFEVIIGDNASTDNTAEVVKKYARKFRTIVYHRHDADIGFARNMDAVMRLARGKYVYLLADDDMAFENTLVLMKTLLDEHPAAVSVTGKYQSSEQPQVGLAAPVREIKAFFIRQGDFSAWFDRLAKNSLLCDGHPFMRREIFQRHCSYDDRSLMLLTLNTRLLAFGDLVFIDQPVIQHCRNPLSVSANMTDHWFHDYSHADIELAVAGAAHALSPQVMEKIRRDFLQVTYLQSARMARIRNDPVLMWHFLRRAKAVGGVDEACLVRCERLLLIDVAVERLHRIIQDTGIELIVAEDTPLMEYLQFKLSRLAPDLEWALPEEATSRLDAALRLFEEAPDSTGATEVAGPYRSKIAFWDVLQSLRLTDHPVSVTVHAGEAVIEFTSPAAELLKQFSKGFAIVMADYAAKAAPGS